MQAILCSRGKGGGCRVMDVPVAEQRDLFGRTEAEVAAFVAREEAILEIRTYYIGGTLPALSGAKLEKWRADILRMGTAGR